MTRKTIVLLFAGAGLMFSGCEGTSEVLAPEPVVCPEPIYDPLAYNDLYHNGFEEYHSTSGLWVGDSGDLVNDPDYDALNGAGKLFIFRSESDFAKYPINDRESLPEIDFSKHTLMIIQGVTNYGIAHMNKNIFLTESGTYALTVEIVHGYTCNCPVWRSAVLVPALPESTEVELRLTRTYP